MSDYGLSDEAQAALKIAEKRPLLASSPNETIMDRTEIMKYMPHRDPILLLDRVTHIDKKEMILAARYDLNRAKDVLGGHFPTRPMYPGVLQIEALGQAGILLALITQSDGPVLSIRLTHVRAARFFHPITPDAGSEMEMVTRVFDDGLFLTVVGQTLQNGVLCAAAACSGLVGDD